MSKTGLQESQAAENREKLWSKKDIHLEEEDLVSEYLSKMDLCKSMSPDGMHTSAEGAG